MVKRSTKQANGVVRQNATKTREMADQPVVDDRLTDRGNAGEDRDA
jgi:hypothetical protein